MEIAEALVEYQKASLLWRFSGDQDKIGMTAKPT